jgi:hypothetical protein
MHTHITTDGSAEAHGSFINKYMHTYTHTCIHTLPQMDQLKHMEGLLERREQETVQVCIHVLCLRIYTSFWHMHVCVCLCVCMRMEGLLERREQETVEVCIHALRLRIYTLCWHMHVCVCVHIQSLSRHNELMA